MKARLLATVLMTAVACSGGNNAAEAPGSRDGIVDVEGAQLRWVHRHAYAA